MKTITSFTVDHDFIDPGMYISRIDGDVTTFDMRTRKPNSGDYMDNLTMHSLEHMFATYIRNSAIGNSVIYFGPMGCRTGFYLLTRNVDKNTVLMECKKALAAIVKHKGKMFGAARKECGNFRGLSLAAAKKEAAHYLAVLENSQIDFKYKAEL